MPAPGLLEREPLEVGMGGMAAATVGEGTGSIQGALGFFLDFHKPFTFKAHYF